MIRRIDVYSGSVTTYANLPKHIIFEAMHCSGVNNIYLAGNDETTSYIYRVRITKILVPSCLAIVNGYFPCLVIISHDLKNHFLFVTNL